MKFILDKWSRTCSLKTFLIAVALIIAVQYLVNLSFYMHEHASLFGPKFKYWSALKNLSGIYETLSTTTRKPLNLSDCPIIPPELQGRVEIDTQIPAWAHIEEENPLLKPGGRYTPPDCIARNRVAIVIPYRDREIHLKLFLQNLHPFLQRQQLDYGIYVVEMASGVQFNRALLFNIGFVEAMKQYDYQCFIFHDVDLLPEDDRNLYTCPHMPRHMSTAIDKLKYKLPYPQIFGGVSAMSTGQFRQINGFSNLYFGWGGEDDDMYRRILYSNLTVTRYSNNVARYKMLVHKKASGNPERFKLLKTVKLRQDSDGITSLNYKLVQLEKKPLFTWLLVSVNMTEVLNSELIHKHLTVPVKQGQVKTVKPEVVKGITSGKQTEVGPKEQGSVKTDNKTDHSKNWLIQGTKKKAPRVVNWVPEDFKGELPDYLTKFTSAKFVYEPPKVKKQPAKKAVGKGQVNVQRLQHEQQQKRQEMIRQQIIASNNIKEQQNRQLQQQRFIQLRKQQIQKRGRLLSGQVLRQQNIPQQHVNIRQAVTMLIPAPNTRGGHNIHGLISPTQMTYK